MEKPRPPTLDEWITMSSAEKSRSLSDMKRYSLTQACEAYHKAVAEGTIRRVNFTKEELESRRVLKPEHVKEIFDAYRSEEPSIYSAIAEEGSLVRAT